MAGGLLSLFKACRGKKKKGPAAAPAQQPEELEQFQPPLQHGAGKDRTQEQDPARGRFRRAAQILRRFLCIGRRKTTTAAAEGTAEPDSRPTELQAKPDASMASTECTRSSDLAMTDPRAKAGMALNEGMTRSGDTTTMTLAVADNVTTPTAAVIHASTLDFFKKNAVLSQQQVPAMVRNIHQRLVSHSTVDARLQTGILRLAEEHPALVVISLLCCAPYCDRAATMMWRTIGSSEPAVERVLPALLWVMQERPLHKVSFSCSFNKDIFALAANVALWVIAQVPECHEAMIHHSASMFVALLSQVYITTEQMPEDIELFWRACMEEHRLPTNPNRFAVQTMKALLCRLSWDNEVVAMERKRVWDTLLCADTQHYAVGLLAREMCRGSTLLCFHIGLYLLRLLMEEQPCWDLLGLAFLVEVLEFLDLTECGVRALMIMSRHLGSQCGERLRLQLRGLVVLSKDPWLGRQICDLYQNLVELLGDADGEMVGMTLSVLINTLQDEDIQISSTTALELAEAVLPLFENDNGLVRLLSIHLFCRVMESVVQEGKKPLMTLVRQSLLPLFLHWRDENQRVAKASREALLCAAQFLERRDLEELLKNGQRMKFAECVLTEDESRAAEHLRWALMCLESPQKHLRHAAIRIIGIAGVLMMGQKEELQVLSEALQALKEDDSDSVTRRFVQVTFEGRVAELHSSSVSGEPVSLKGLQIPWKMRPPGGHWGPAAALGTADATHS